MISAIFVGMLTNCLTIAFGALTGAFALILRYKRPLRSYGIRQQQDGIRIILPRLDIKAGGAAAAITIDKGYAGPAVAQPEYEAAVLLQEQIRPNVSAWFSREIRDWISGKLVIAAAANPMGGPAYNAAAGHFQIRPGDVRAGREPDLRPPHPGLPGEAAVVPAGRRRGLDGVDGRDPGPGSRAGGGQRVHGPCPGAAEDRAGGARGRDPGPGGHGDAVCASGLHRLPDAHAHR